MKSSKQKTYFLVTGLSSVRATVAVEFVPATLVVTGSRVQALIYLPTVLIVKKFVYYF
jgi:hypothetical protein